MTIARLVELAVLIVDHTNYNRKYTKQGNIIAGFRDTISITFDLKE